MANTGAPWRWATIAAGSACHIFLRRTRCSYLANAGAAALLAPSLALNPDRRVPGAFDAFELGVSAIIGQQVTMKAAITVNSRFAAFGEPCETPFRDLTCYAAQPDSIASLTVDDVALLGMVSARSRAIISYAGVRWGDAAL